jgi:hypothetical protein
MASMLLLGKLMGEGVKRSAAGAKTASACLRLAVVSLPKRILEHKHSIIQEQRRLDRSQERGKGSECFSSGG